MFKVTLKRLRAFGCIAFDSETIYWTGRALPVRYVTDVEERARLQLERNATLAALRPPGAPAVDTAAFPAWQPRKRLVVTDGMRATLARFKGKSLKQSEALSLVDTGTIS